MPGILDLSAAMIDSGELLAQPLRITNELSEIADGIALVESFSNVVAVSTAGGLVLFDASGKATGGAVVKALRSWSAEPVHTIVYTHGHVDHVGGSGAFVADARSRGHRAPTVVGHINVPVRFDRYRLTDAWNIRINRRQFAGIRPQEGLGLVVGDEFLPHDIAPCTETFTDRRSLSVGELTIDLRHAKGETDDHTWAWLPQYRAIATGDFITWVFPNAGNPQKVQRYPLEWARALREMAALDPELLLPAHALPVSGAARIRTMLATIAGVLERLVGEVIDAMNAGATLDEIVASVHVDEALLSLPYLRPIYDEPEFVVRNIWRLYGGWWDGNAARLKPPSDAALGAEVASLAGGVARLVQRAQELTIVGDHRMACQLIEFATGADPSSAAVHEARSHIYAARRKAEKSLMAKGVYAEAASSSASRIERGKADAGHLSVPPERQR